MRSIAPFRPALALALLLALTSGCAKRDANAPSAGGSAVAPVSGGTLVYARGHDSVRLDPGHETDGESCKVMDNVYENLVSFADTTTELVPELATRWDISPDGLTYTFHLRQGVTFHDGTPFNAEAVVFSLDRQRDKKPAHPFHSVGGPYPYWQAMSMDDIVADLKATDDSTVVFTLKRRNAPFLANLAMGFASIISPTAAKQHGEDFFKRPSGTGPFRFVAWTKDDSITLERYPEYWGEKAYLDRVVFRVIPETTVRLLALREGSVHGLEGLYTVLARQLQAELDYRDSVAIAFKEVRDALAAHGEARASLVTSQRRSDALQRAAQLTRLRFEGGEASRLLLIDAERLALLAQLQVQDERRGLLSAQAEVYRALGGGWQAPQRQAAR